jgi:hypothetical protein
MIKEITDLVFNSCFKRSDHKWSFVEEESDPFPNLLFSKSTLIAM